MQELGVTGPNLEYKGADNFLAGEAGPESEYEAVCHRSRTGVYIVMGLIPLYGAVPLFTKQNTHQQKTPQSCTVTQVMLSAKQVATGAPQLHRYR